MSAGAEVAGDHRPALGVYRLLGRGRGAALVSPSGTVDWWCPDDFDAEPLLWALLDRRGAAAGWRGAEIAVWDERPAGPTAHTTVRIGGARVELWDGLVPVGDGSALVRLARSDRDGTAIEHRMSLGGFGGASRPPLIAVAVGAAGVFVSDVEVTCRLETSSSEWRGVAVLVGTPAPTGVSSDGPVDGEWAIELLRRAERDDARSMRDVRLPHHHPQRVTDALHVLHALTDASTGAPVAAATTSLPESIGGPRQYDYRYSWLRDAAYATATAALLGHTSASRHYLAFLGELRVRYGEHLAPLTTSGGNPVPGERIVDGVSGWAGSQPVREGNDAGEQRQLDAVATVIEAIWVHLANGGRRGRDVWELVEWLAELLVRAPYGPSHGIWEFRTPRVLVTEELARWIGLDRAIRAQRLLRPWSRRPAWHTMRAVARRRVEGAFDDASGLLPQSFDGSVVPDAAVLLAATNGFFRRDDPRLHRLVRGLIAALDEGPFLRRYPPLSDGLEGVEGSFVPASWWAVSALCAIGDLDGAERRADDMCARLPRLLPEEWDVGSASGLGNVPLLWSHTQAARALYDLHGARVRRRVGRAGYWAWRSLRYVRLRFGGSRSSTRSNGETGCSQSA